MAIKLHAIRVVEGTVDGLWKILGIPIGPMTPECTIINTESTAAVDIPILNKLGTSQLQTRVQTMSHIPYCGSYSYQVMTVKQSIQLDRRHSGWREGDWIPGFCKAMGKCLI